MVIPLEAFQTESVGQVLEPVSPPAVYEFGSDAPITVEHSNRLPAVFLSEQPAPVAEISAAAEEEPESRVRGATPDDVEDLVRVELGAYSEVYGELTDQKVQAVRDKYTERVNLLGDWIRVLEDPKRGVYGMMVCCPMNLTREDFMAPDNERDMTDNAVLNEVHDPEGKNVYIVNLAILPHDQGKGGRFDLFADAIQKGVPEGIKHTYFESRLPGFDRWLSRELPGQDIGELPQDEVDAYADKYWQTTKPRYGEEKPIDPLLRMYVDFGCQPLRLVPDAWKTDYPSKGYGVLCEFTTPTDDTETDEPQETLGTNEVVQRVGQALVAAEVVDGNDDEEAPQIVEEEPAVIVGFFSKAVQWAKAHKRAIALTTAVGGIAYSMATHSGQELLSDLKEDASWLAPAYGASLAAFFGGAAMMAVAAGNKVWHMFHHDEDAEPQEVKHDNLMKAGFWANTAGGVGAAAVIAAGVVDVLPPTAWAALTIPALDAYSTLITRSWLYNKIAVAKH